MTTQKIQNISVQEALLFARKYFQKRGIPAKEAEWLVAHLLKLSPAELWLQEERILEGEMVSRFFQCVQERLVGKPLPYLLGEWEFMSLPIQVNSHVLIPRPETEVLVEVILQNLPPKARVLELGTGSGCIAISLCVYGTPLFLMATDVSACALEVAKENARRLNVLNQICFLQSDMFQKVPNYPLFDAIVMNPPYIGERERGELPLEVSFEPACALFGGEDGLLYYHILADEAPKYLASDGFLAVEISGTQSTARYVEIFQRDPFSQIEVYADYSGKDRVLLVQKGAKSHV